MFEVICGLRKTNRRVFFSFSSKKPMRNLEKVFDNFDKKSCIDFHFLYRLQTWKGGGDKNINRYLGLFNFFESQE